MSYTRAYGRDDARTIAAHRAELDYRIRLADAEAARLRALRDALDEAAA